MKREMLIPLVVIAVGCMSGRALANESASETWHGFMLRDGLRVPISLQLASDGAAFGGQFRVGESSFPLAHVQVSALAVHFELPGGLVFDGTMAGNAMAGSVTGTHGRGSFTLAREERAFTDPIFPSGP